MRLIDADALKEKSYRDEFAIDVVTVEDIDNAPTVEVSYLTNCANCERVEKIRAKRPQGKCKTCRYYHPYYEQFSNKPRGDGYCVIARMSPEGMTTINCNDEFGCSDYMKGGAE